MVGNEAHRGGGIYEGDTEASITLAAVLVANNTADDQGADCYADVVSDDYNLIENATGCDISGTTAHNITGQDPALSPLQDNGGHTDTHLPKFGSPGLDVIPNGTLDCGTTVQVDQRAQPRPTDSDDSGTATCDVGAVEPTYDEIAPVVTNLGDSGNGSLRGVLAAVASGTTVTFDPSLSGQTIDLTSGQLTLDTDVTVDASALPESITIQGGPGRVFWVTPTANATLSHLTIRGGDTDFGGGISNDGTLTVRSSTIRNNEASDRGGGIDNDGTLTLEQVTVEGNRASGGAGGINNDGPLTILSSTIYDNEGQQGGDGDGNIYNAGEMHLIGSIVASGDGGDCVNEGTLGSVAYSLVEDGTCLPSGSTTNLTGAPELGALQDNGGGMLTYAPLSGSPVIDQGSCSGTTTDQRGEDRPYDDPSIPNADDGCDMGSVEVPGPDAIDLAVSAFLEGPMQSVQMAVGLTDHLPETDPYFGAQSVPSGYFTSDPDGQRVVDWVVLQLRTGDPASPPMTVAAERAALLLDDGTVLDTDGSPTVTMDGASGAYYVVVGHRNHLWAMSDVAVNCSGGSCGFDFTAGTAYGTNALKDLGGGLFGLYAGDASANGQVQNDDKNNFWRTQSGSSGYQSADFSLNAQVQNDDKNNYWRGNSGRGTQVPSASTSSASFATPIPTARQSSGALPGRGYPAGQRTKGVTRSDNRRP
ncbi:MAG: hypothetical protein GVY18_16675 [Bacteroidetes bacterium]|nr:hypothetical protein [Bacteroidota bacterium]